MEFINKIYESEYFVIVLFSVIAILTFLFVLVAVLGRKDKKKNKESEAEVAFEPINETPAELNVAPGVEEAPTMSEPIVVEETPVMTESIVVEESPIESLEPQAIEETVSEVSGTSFEPIVFDEPLSAPAPEEPVASEPVVEVTEVIEPVSLETQPIDTITLDDSPIIEEPVVETVIEEPTPVVDETPIMEGLSPIIEEPTPVGPVIEETVESPDAIEVIETEELTEPIIDTPTIEEPTPVEEVAAVNPFSNVFDQPAEPVVEETVSEVSVFDAPDVAPLPENNVEEATPTVTPENVFSNIEPTIQNINDNNEQF